MRPPVAGPPVLRALLAHRFVCVGRSGHARLGEDLPSDARLPAGGEVGRARDAADLPGIAECFRTASLTLLPLDTGARPLDDIDALAGGADRSARLRLQTSGTIHGAGVVVAAPVPAAAAVAT